MINKNNPKVSIAITSYNHEDFITECFESILAQKWDNLEINISDDCSIDSTRAKITSFAKKHPGFFNKILFPNKNKGIAGNANNVLKECTGEFIVFFSGDDVMLPGKISQQVEALEKNSDAIFCYSNAEWFHSNSNRKLFNHFGMFNKVPNSIRDVIKDFSIPTITLMLKKEAIPDLHIDDTYPILCDYKMVIDMMQRGKSIYIPKVLVRYRKHSGSITYKTTFHQERFDIVKDLQLSLPMYYKELNAYKATGYYARSRFYFSNGNLIKGIDDFIKILPYSFHSIKWAGRVLLVIKDITLCCIKNLFRTRA